MILCLANSKKAEKPSSFYSVGSHNRCGMPSEIIKLRIEAPSASDAPAPPSIDPFPFYIHPGTSGIEYRLIWYRFSHFFFWLSSHFFECVWKWFFSLDCYPFGWRTRKKEKRDERNSIFFSFIRCACLNAYVFLLKKTGDCHKAFPSGISWACVSFLKEKKWLLIFLVSLFHVFNSQNLLTGYARISGWRKPNFPRSTEFPVVVISCLYICEYL